MENHWIPAVDHVDLTRTLVVIPTFRNNPLTWTAIRDCLREPVRIMIVDNGGDYEKTENEMVLRPGQNLGWLRANNLAITIALESLSWDRIVLLNNDVRLSRGFFAGIIWGEASSRASIVAASYDDSREVQRPENLRAGETLDAEQYRPVRRNIATGACDGTAVSIRRDAVESIGLLDDERFGKYGWGGIEDFCFRARAAGLKIIATRAAYVHHVGGGHQTANRVIGAQYTELANAEGSSGMTQKWGPNWKNLKRLSTEAEVEAALGTKKVWQG